MIKDRKKICQQYLQTIPQNAFQDVLENRKKYVARQLSRGEGTVLETNLDVIRAIISFLLLIHFFLHKPFI